MYPNDCYNANAVFFALKHEKVFTMYNAVHLTEILELVHACMPTVFNEKIYSIII